jgi:glutamine amidotransferase
MCRLFGMSSGSRPARATFWLLEAPDSLSEQSRREPDGTGIGWFDANGLPQVDKQPVAAYGDREFARRARELSSRTFVAHVRFASTGELTLNNTHPFEQAGRVFAHNGVIEDLGALERRAGTSMQLVQGETDSERFFALITHEIAARDGSVPQGIASACRWVAANLPLLSINFVLATEGELWALRYPETHELHVLECEPGRPVEHRSSLGTRVSASGEAATVTVATERLDDDPAWRAIEPGELLHVSAALEVRSHTVLPEPPAHPLTLADLSGKARDSQAPSTG